MWGLFDKWGSRKQYCGVGGEGGTPTGSPTVEEGRKTAGSTQQGL